MNEVEKELLMKKTKYYCLVRQFWAPEKRAEHNARMEKAGSLPGSAQDNRAASAISSVKESIGDKSRGEEIPKYSPLVPEMWKERMLEFSNLHVVKFQRIFQSAMYLLKFKCREDICERGTNLLIWKKIKPYFQIENDDSFYRAISMYQPFGQKTDEYKEYEKLLFCRDNLDGLDEEIIDEYSVTLGKLYRWLVFTIDLRVGDVRERRYKTIKDREARADAIEREEERKQRRAEALDEAKEAFNQQVEADREARDEDAKDEEDAKFNEEDFNQRYDEENIPIEIPPEVTDDEDNDMNVEDEEEGSQE